MKKLVTFLAFFAVLLVACPAGDETGTASSPFFGGTEGIKISFIEGFPPSTPILDQSRVPFDIVLNIENVGEWDVANANDAVFTISGISPTDFGKTSADFTKPSNLQLLGIKKDSQGNKLPGTATQLQFTGLAYRNKISGSQQFTINANACYKYGTKASSKVCVRGNLLNPTANGCSPREPKQAFVSGAPMWVENLQQTVESSDRIVFTFNVVPKGAGSYYQLASGCAEDLAKKNKVKVTVGTGIGSGAVCNLQDEQGSAINSNTGYVTLFGPSRIVRCVQEIPSGEIGDYEKVVDITLEYDYKESIQKQITVSS